MDVALLSILRDGLLRRSEAAALTWADVDLRDNGSALLQVRRSKTDPEAEGVTLYMGRDTATALQAIRNDKAGGSLYGNDYVLPAASGPAVNA